MTARNILVAQISLAALAVVALAGAIALQATGSEIPDILPSVVTLAVGGLLGILVVPKGAS